MCQLSTLKLSVEYHVGLDASVLVSKSAGRYRVQQHRQSAPFAGPQLARCALPGRAWRLRAAGYSQSEAPAT